MTIAALHGDSSAALTPNGVPGSRSAAGSALFPIRRRRRGSYPPKKWADNEPPSLCLIPDRARILAKAKWLSVDPRMRGRMSPRNMSAAASSAQFFPDQHTTRTTVGPMPTTNAVTQLRHELTMVIPRDSRVQGSSSLFRNHKCASSSPRMHGTRRSMASIEH
jgi:hypothetical protein